MVAAISSVCIYHAQGESDAAHFVQTLKTRKAESLSTQIQHSA